MSKKSNDMQSMQKHIEQRLVEFNNLEKEDLIYLSLFFEHQMAVMSSELQILEHIEVEKEEMLEAEDISDEELEAKFQELSSYLQQQLENFTKINEDFKEIFDKKATKAVKELIETLHPQEDIDNLNTKQNKTKKH